MNYKVKFSKKAEKQLKKLDKPIRKKIIKWIENNLWNTTNPKQHGKGLVGNHSGEWRYRVENYRIIAVIHDDIITIEVLQVGHRKDIYD